MLSTRRGALALSVVAIGVTVAACGGGGGSNAGSSGSSAPTGGSQSTGSAGGGSAAISEAGSTLLYPLFEAWDPAYHSAHSGVTITAQGIGSGPGIAEATAGAVDIGASDAYLSPGERSASPALENIALAISAQQIDYNLPGFATKHLRLDGQVLARMYTGKITKWNDPAIAALNPGVALPGTTVVPVHRSDGSGDTFLFTQYLTKQDPTDWGKIGYGTTVAFPSVPGALGEHGNGGMVSGCGATKGCVAYIGISYLDKATKAGLGYAMLRNAAGNYELPTPGTIAAEAAGFVGKTPADETISLIDGPAAGGYPIVNYEYAIVKSSLSGSTAAAVRAFLTWAVATSGGNAAGFLDPVHFQPLPASVRQLSLDQINKIGT